MTIYEGTGHEKNEVKNNTGKPLLPS